ncbi:MAG: hypothetical protein HYU52_14145 [Acidobacteria bacterium]|nr:hypothetical protein [Acidobacteriota bacterium]
MIAGLVLSFLLAGGEAPLPLMNDCAGCHEDQVAQFSTGRHGRAMAARSSELLQQSCASCHSGAAKHLEDPSSDSIERIPGAPACAKCHSSAESTIQLGTPGHVRNKVSCLDCHAGGHETSERESLLRSDSREFCSGCHRPEAARFELPFAHRDESREPMDCMNCHSIHGIGRVSRLGALDKNGACVECHGELAGPYVFEHPPRQVEGCGSCHDVHGSPNPRQLRRHSVALLCAECHGDLPRSHDATSARYRNCTGCHSAIHGSNRDARLFDR